MVLLPESLHALKQVAKEVGLDLRGAYLNLDGGFDSAHNRKCIFNAGLIPGSVPVTGTSQFSQPDTSQNKGFYASKKGLYPI